LAGTTSSEEGLCSPEFCVVQKRDFDVQVVGFGWLIKGSQALGGS